MSDPIEHLEERDDVRKMEYEHYETSSKSQVKVELWHDIDGLQRIAERSMTGVALSQKGMQNLAEDEALAVRETRTDLWALYPEFEQNL